MDKSPIYTVVHNNCSIDKSLCWAGSKNVYVSANSDTEVPYDVWSLSSPGQREGIITEIADGSVTVTVYVFNGSEYVETRMVPYEHDNVPSVTTPVTAPAERASAVLESIVTEDKAFNIVAHTDTTESNKAYYGAGSEPAVPVVETQEGDGAAKGDDIVAEPVVETAVADDSSDEEKFDALCAARHWSEALALLKKVFGDKVTFGSRALIPLKTWAAVTEKYGLLK